MNRFIAFKSVRAGVGKFIGNSKIKYEWPFSVGNDTFVLTLLVSKISKKHRIILNNRLISEEVVNQDHYYFKLILEGRSLEIQKNSNGVYELLIDRESYERIALNTSNNSSLDDYKKRNQNLRILSSFLVEKGDKFYKIVRTDESTLPGSEKQIPSVKDLPGSNRGSLNGQPAFNQLDDSEDLYNHDFLYLFIKEQNEDLEMVNVVNNLQ